VAAHVDEVLALGDLAGLADTVDEPLDPRETGLDLVVADEVRGIGGEDL
jgi:hypothetical protein